MTTLFLSYARDDDEPFVWRLHQNLRNCGFDVWFDRVTMPSRNLTFHQEIRDAIAARDRLLLVVGPKAATSDYVRQEWQFAWFEAEKIVTPILRVGDYSIVPDELRLLHCEDFREEAKYAHHLEQLVRSLREPAAALGKLVSVPPLPPHFLSRTDGLIKVRDALRLDLDQPVVISGAAMRVGLHGMGGIGKTVLATAVARDRKVREAFPDGVIWIRLGSNPDLRARMQDVHRVLGGDGIIADEREGNRKLKELLKDKAVLLVIDDVWKRADLDAFDSLGSRCRTLITTRDARLLASIGSVQHVVGLLTPEEALRLLAAAAGIESDALPSTAHEVLAECGRLPLAIALAGGMVRSGTAWHDVRDALREHELEFLEDPHAAAEHHVNLWRTIEVSVRALPVDVQLRLAELAAFPESELIPDGTVATLWQHTGELSPRQSRKVLVDLKQRSLLQLAHLAEATSDERGQVSLHSLIHDYCVRLARQRLGAETACHTRLLDAYRRMCPEGWWTGPNDGYFLDHLRVHLVAAGRGGELADLQCEPRWYEAKNAAGLVFDLPRDFAAAIGALPARDERGRILALLKEALWRDIHFIALHAEDYPAALFQSLWNHGVWYDCPEAADHFDAPPGEESSWTPPWKRAGPRLSSWLRDWRQARRQSRKGPWLRSLFPLPRLDSPQRRILNGHENEVTATVFAADGYHVVSASRDATVRVWDVERGMQLWCLEGHKRDLLALASHPRDPVVASGSTDHTIRLWNIETGQLLHTLVGHENSIFGLAFSPDGRLLASASADKTIRLWDVASARELSCLRGHENIVFDAAFLHGALVSIAQDKTIRFWNIRDPEQPQEIGKIALESAPQGLAVSPLGRFAALGMSYGKVLLLDSILGCLRSFEGGHQGPGAGNNVPGIAFSPDGKSIASTGDDSTARVWDVLSGKERVRLEGHRGWCRAIAFDSAGQRLATGGFDRTVRIWDLAAARAMPVRRGHVTGMSGMVLGFTVSADDRLLAGNIAEGSIFIWDLDSGRLFRRLSNGDGRLGHATFLRGGRLLTTGGKDDLLVWSVAAGSVLCQMLGAGGKIDEISLSGDGTAVAALSGDRTLHVWDTRTAQERFRAVAEERLGSPLISPDGRVVTARELSRSLRIWDVTSGSEVGRVLGEQDAVEKFRFSPTGRWLAIDCADDTLKLWDVRAGCEPAWFTRVADPQCVAFSADNETVAVGTAQGEVLICDAHGTCLRRLNGGRGRVSALHWTGNNMSADPGREDTWLVSATPGLLRVWDSRSGNLVREMPFLGAAVHALESSPDGARIAFVAFVPAEELVPEDRKNVHFILRLRALKARGIVDPDIDLWLAVIGDEVEALEKACKAGANVNLTDSDLIERYEDIFSRLEFADEMRQALDQPLPRSVMRQIRERGEQSVHIWDMGSGACTELGDVVLDLAATVRFPMILTSTPSETTVQRLMDGEVIARYPLPDLVTIRTRASGRQWTVAPRGFFLEELVLEDAE